LREAETDGNRVRTAVEPGATHWANR
jgi:hypothetical protein